MKFSCYCFVLLFSLFSEFALLRVVLSSRHVQGFLTVNYQNRLNLCEHCPFPSGTSVGFGVFLFVLVQHI